MEKFYFISDASRMVNVEAHVLRFWEEELTLNIPRNELGHRYYTEEHMNQFKKIKTLKEYGYQLKAIKLLLPKLAEFGPEEIEFLKEFSEDMNQKAAMEEEEGENPAPTNVVPLPQSTPVAWSSEEKMAQFQEMMNDVVGRAIVANSAALSAEMNRQMGDQISQRVLKEIDYMLKIKEELEEERFHKLDERLRAVQNARSEAASTAAPKPSRPFFKKKN